MEKHNRTSPFAALVWVLNIIPTQRHPMASMSMTFIRRFAPATASSFMIWLKLKSYVARRERFMAETQLAVRLISPRCNHSLVKHKATSQLDTATTTASKLRAPSISLPQRIWGFELPAPTPSVMLTSRIGCQRAQFRSTQTYQARLMGIQLRDEILEVATLSRCDLMHI